MERNYKVEKLKIMILLASMTFIGCKINNPQIDDIVGTWIANDSAKFIFLRDGKFFASRLPRNVTYFPDDQIINKKFNGYGEWTLNNEGGTYKIKLDFYKTNNLKTGYATQILISGSTGFLENDPPWYLFEWKTEEGGDRYIFKKQFF
jgi:hypothetical protein